MARHALTVVAVLAAAALAWWVYAPVLSAYLVSDDFQWIEGAVVFSPARLFEVGSRTHFYRPTIELYFAAEYWQKSTAAPWRCSPRTSR